MSDLTETLQDLSNKLQVAYQEIMAVNTMLETLMEAHAEETSGHMCSIILDRNRTVSEAVELASRDLGRIRLS